MTDLEKIIAPFVADLLGLPASESIPADALRYARPIAQAVLAEQQGTVQDEDKLRRVLVANPYFGDWDEWRNVADQLPVLPRMALSHLYGHHDGPDKAGNRPIYAHCVLCMTFREETVEAGRG